MFLKQNYYLFACSIVRDASDEQLACLKRILNWRMKRRWRLKRLLVKRMLCKEIDFRSVDRLCQRMKHRERRNKRPVMSLSNIHSTVRKRVELKVVGVCRCKISARRSTVVIETAKIHKLDIFK